MAMGIDSLKGMSKMVGAMLPYEDDYKTKTDISKCLNEIIEIIVEYNPKISEYGGFIGYVLKQIDSSTESQEVLMEIMDRISLILLKEMYKGE